MVQGPNSFFHIKWFCILKLHVLLICGITYGIYILNGLFIPCGRLLPTSSTISIDLIKLRFEYWIYTILVNSKYLTEVLIRQKVNYEHVHCKGLLIYFVNIMLTLKRNFWAFFFLARSKHKVVLFCSGPIDFPNYTRKTGFHFPRSLFDIKWSGISAKAVIKTQRILGKDTRFKENVRNSKSFY